MRRREFLDEMEQVVPWAEMVARVSPCLPEGQRGCLPFSPTTMLRIHVMQQRGALRGPAMEAARHDMPVFRAFAVLNGWGERLPGMQTFPKIICPHLSTNDGRLSAPPAFAAPTGASPAAKPHRSDGA